MENRRETIFGRLRAGYRARELRVLAVYILGITAFLTLLALTRVGPFSWGVAVDEALAHLIYTAAIVLSCHVLVVASGVFADPLSWRRFFFLVALLLGGAVVGTMVGGLTVRLLLGAAEPTSWARLLLFDCGAALFFGAGSHIYFLLRDRGERLARELGAREVLTQQLIQARTRAELTALKAQVNPHFLFNTLNSIAELIPSDPERAEATVQKLAHVFRYVLDASGREAVTLGEEIATVQRYLAIEQIRLGERLRTRVDVDEDAHAVRIPALLLQPLVENAVKHGIAPLTGGGTVEVTGRLQNSRCLVSVRDTGAGFRKRNEAGFGLRCVRQRLDLFYGGAAQVDVEDKQGVTVSLSLPVVQPPLGAA